MKKLLIAFTVLGIFDCFSASSYAQQPSSTPASQGTSLQPHSSINKADYPLKPFHQNLQLTCSNCHREENEADYQALTTADCLSCHGSAEKVAQRTGFMDANQTNPHRSLHDGLDLDCYECHAEHQPSPSNLCETCHDNTGDWFGPTP